ncbi:histone acetyltransferase type B catalytic subunit [Wyeomyia smithii]|uniref:histone acetyltransferase type B catalytic subunit n=1 Tax=Wyeomyia smithii TaxID=174621 RepID=UPI002467E467|nr:histone acetyltransferase type B catalytic subunit [Wyeomyia smithii]
MSSISKLQNYVSNALECTRFRLIRKEQDFDDESVVFHPEMAHQIFGEQESVFGYRDLQIDVCFAAGSLDIYFNVKYSEKVDDVSPDGGVKADDVEKALAELVEDGCYYTNLEEYKKIVEVKTAGFKPFGNKVDEFKLNPGICGQEERTFEVYVSDINDKDFLKYHSRLESLSFWFIDAFSRVEHDPLWLFFIVYEKYSDGNETRYATAGYFTVYQYYSYPQFIRPRISQILVLPPFQKLGIASWLIETTVNKYFLSMSNVADITYEEPTDIIQHIRSVVDAKHCMTLPAFAKDKLLSGFSKEMLKEAKEKYKINPKQCRVIYEILRLSAIDTKNETDYRNYRVEVKKRLNLNNSKHQRALVRLQKRGVDVSAALSLLPTLEDRIEQLNAEYQQVEQVYHQVLKKLKLARD